MTTVTSDELLLKAISWIQERERADSNLWTHSVTMGQYAQGMKGGYPDLETMLWREPIPETGKYAIEVPVRFVMRVADPEMGADDNAPTRAIHIEEPVYVTIGEFNDFGNATLFANFVAYMSGDLVEPAWMRTEVDFSSYVHDMQFWQTLAFPTQTWGKLLSSGTTLNAMHNLLPESYQVSELGLDPKRCHSITIGHPFTNVKYPVAGVPRMFYWSRQIPHIRTNGLDLETIGMIMNERIQKVICFQEPRIFNREKLGWSTFVVPTPKIHPFFVRNISLPPGSGKTTAIKQLNAEGTVVDCDQLPGMDKIFKAQNISGGDRDFLYRWNLMKFMALSGDGPKKGLWVHPCQGLMWTTLNLHIPEKSMFDRISSRQDDGIRSEYDVLVRRDFVINGIPMSEKLTVLWTERQMQMWIWYQQRVQAVNPKSYEITCEQFESFLASDRGFRIPDIVSPGSIGAWSIIQAEIYKYAALPSSIKINAYAKASLANSRRY